MYMGFDNPFDIPSTFFNGGTQLVGAFIGYSPGRIIDVQNRIDNRTLAGSVVDDNIGNGVGLIVEVRFYFGL